MKICWAAELVDYDFVAVDYTDGVYSVVSRVVGVKFMWISGGF